MKTTCTDTEAYSRATPPQVFDLESANLPVSARFSISNRHIFQSPPASLTPFQDSALGLRFRTRTRPPRAEKRENLVELTTSDRTLNLAN